MIHAALIQVDENIWYLATEADNWIAGPHIYGPFASMVRAKRQVHEHFPHVDQQTLAVCWMESRDHWDPQDMKKFVRMTKYAIPPMPDLVKKATKEVASVDMAAMEIYCECGSTDLQLEIVDIVAKENPDGPWLIECNECGGTLDVYPFLHEEGYDVDADLG